MARNRKTSPGSRRRSTFIKTESDDGSHLKRDLLESSFAGMVETNRKAKIVGGILAGAGLVIIIVVLSLIGHGSAPDTPPHPSSAAPVSVERDLPKKEEPQKLAPKTGVTMVPRPQPAADKGALFQGVAYWYYEGSWGSFPNFAALTPKATGNTEAIDLFPRKRDTHFGIVFSGLFSAVKDGEYTFFLKSNNEAVLFVNGREIAKNTGKHGTNEASGRLQLTHGRHPVIVLYIQRGGDRWLELKYEGPEQPKRTVPPTLLAYSAQIAGAKPNIPADAAAAFEPAQKTQGELIVLEAENFSGSVQQENYSWKKGGRHGGYSGSGYVVAVDSVKDAVRQANSEQNPRLDYEIYFPQAGKYYLWIRNFGPDDKSDSVNFGINGKIQETAVAVSRIGSRFGWVGKRMTGQVAFLNVERPGTHMLNMFFREAGMIVDKIVLTTDEDYVPTGAGPAESRPIEILDDATKIAARLANLRSELVKANPGLAGSEDKIVVRNDGEDGIYIDMCRIAAVRDLAPLAGLPITELILFRTSVENLDPLRGMPLRNINLYECRELKDISGLYGAPLETFYMFLTKVDDISALAKSPLKTVRILSCQVADISVLKGMKIEALDICDTPVTDISVLKDMPLRELGIRCGRGGLKDVSVLKTLPGLERLILPSGLGDIEFLRDFKKLRVLTDKATNMHHVTDEQTPEVFWRERDAARTTGNVPSHTGVKTAVMEPVKEKDAGKWVEILNSRKPDSKASWNARLGGLFGNFHARKLEDVEFLAGIPFSALNLSQNNIKSIAPLAGMPLKELIANGVLLENLSPLTGLPLVRISLKGCPVSDLTPLAGLPLREINLENTKVNDIAALAGLKLQTLQLSVWSNSSRVKDVSALKGMPLEHLTVRSQPIADISVLAGMPLKYLDIQNTKVSDISALRDMPVVALGLAGCDELREFSVLKTLKHLTSLTLPGNAGDISFLKNAASLKFIDDRAANNLSECKRTAGEFWKQYKGK